MAKINRTVLLDTNIHQQNFLSSENTMSEELKMLCALAKFQGGQIDKWKLLDDAYRASGGFETGEYLIPHPSEKETKYLRRQNMAYFINYVKPVVDSHVNPIFKNKPIRTKISPTYEKFVDDVDGNKTSLTRFMKKAAIRAKLHGVEFIVVDMERLNDGEIITEKEVIEKRLFPYLYLISPSNINKWAVDKFGRLIYISYTVENNIIDEEGNIKTIGETWTWTNTICKKTINGQEEEIFNNPIGMIPIIPLYGAINDSNTLIPQSDVYAIARTNHSLYNACSELRERNRAQAFSILTFPISEEDDYDTGDEPIRYGTADCILYKGTTAKAPQFITPPSASSNIIMDEINFCIKEIYRMASLQLITG